MSRLHSNIHHDRLDGGHVHDEHNPEGLHSHDYIDYCEMCGTKMPKTIRDKRSINICKKCLRGQMKTFKR